MKTTDGRQRHGNIFQKGKLSRLDTERVGWPYPMNVHQPSLQLGLYGESGIRTMPYSQSRPVLGKAAEGSEGPRLGHHGGVAGNKAGVLMS